MKILHKISFILVIVGGLNWLLVGLFSTDIGLLLFGGQDATVSKIVYILVGLAAIYLMFTHGSCCKCCSGDKDGKMPESKPAM
jgi:uncharacterized membrane protein YuzA (DUF378 family)